MKDKTLGASLHCSCTSNAVEIGNTACVLSKTGFYPFTIISFIIDCRFYCIIGYPLMQLHMVLAADTIHDRPKDLDSVITSHLNDFTNKGPSY